MSEPLSDERLANLFQRITKGPWFVHHSQYGDQEHQRLHPLVGCESGEVSYVARLMCTESTMTGMSSRGPSLEAARANAELIAIAPDLLSEVHRLRAEVERLTPKRVMREPIPKISEDW